MTQQTEGDDSKEDAEAELDSAASQKAKIIESHVAQLCEHFDSVRIFTTKYRGDHAQTLSQTRSGGNWYASFGFAKEWVVKEESKMTREPD